MPAALTDARRFRGLDIAPRLEPLCARILRESAVIVDVEELARAAGARIARLRRAGMAMEPRAEWELARVRETLDALLLAEAIPLEPFDRATTGLPRRRDDWQPSGRERFVARVLSVPPEKAERAARAFNGLSPAQRRILFDVLLERRGLQEARIADEERGDAVGELSRALGALAAAIDAGAKRRWQRGGPPGSGFGHTLAPRPAGRDESDANPIKPKRCHLP